METVTLKPDVVFTIDYPFIRDTYSYTDDSGDHEDPCWMPGTTYHHPAEDWLDNQSMAEGVGAMVLTIVSTHKPGKYPERVFYTRKWIDPDGKTFGSGALKIKSKSAFLRLLNGFRYEYRLVAIEQRAA